MEKKELKPAGVFRFFEEICQIPRPSKHEEKIIAYLQEFGKKYNLKTTTDACGNVLLEKPATPGMEKRKTVVLQVPELPLEHLHTTIMTSHQKMLQQ